MADLEILKAIRVELKSKEMLNDQAKDLLKRLILQSAKPKTSPKEERHKSGEHTNAGTTQASVRPGMVSHERVALRAMVPRAFDSL